MLVSVGNIPFKKNLFNSTLCCIRFDFTFHIYFLKFTVDDYQYFYYRVCVLVFIYTHKCRIDNTNLLT